MPNNANLPAAPATTTVGAPQPGALYRAHHDEAKNLRAGRIFLKFSKGDWFIGKEAEQFPDNEFYFVPAMDMFERGWQCWSGGRPVDERFVPYGTPPILENTLPDHGPYAAKNDGWMEALKFPLIIVPYGKNTTAWLNVEFAASSAGGKNMVYSLSKQFSEKIKLGEITQQKCFVLCRAGTDHYMHKEYGRVYYPTVEIVGALTQAEVEKLIKSAVTTNAAGDPTAGEEAAAPAKPAAPDALDKKLDKKPVKITVTAAPAPAPTDPPFEVSYKAIRDGKSTGPYTLVQLAEGVEANWFKPETLVWTKGMAGWVKAETIAGFAALFEPAEPEAPEPEVEPEPEPEPPEPEPAPPPPPPPAGKKTNRKKISV